MSIIHNDSSLQPPLNSDFFSTQSSLTSDDRAHEASTHSDEKSIVFLAEAKQKYPRDPPPFVTRKKGKEPVPKEVVFARPNGQKPKDPSTATFAFAVPRRWKNNEFFWTLDLYHERWIVGLFSGGDGGGVQWFRWFGATEEFGFGNTKTRAIAFSPNFNQNGVNAHRDREHTTNNNKSLQIPIKQTSNQQNSQRFGKSTSKFNNSRQGNPTNSIRDHRRSSSERQPDNCKRVSNPVTRLTDSEENAAKYPRRVRSTNGLVEPERFQRRQSSENEQEKVQVRDSLGSIDEVSDVSSDDVPLRPTCSRKRSRAIFERDDTYDATPLNSDETYKPSPSQACEPSNSITGSSQEKSRTSPTSVPSGSSPLTVALHPDKIDRTTLLLCISSSPDDFFPLSLRSCMTITTFFNSVLGALDVDEVDLDKVRISLPWMPGKTLVMKRSPVDIFEWFLKAINKAPCWERGEECDLKVEISLK